MIRIDNLHKSFKSKTGTVHAVKGVGFQARDGEITGLLGPNGVGKTTTLRMLYTLMSPDQGRIEVDGIDVAADPTAVRQRLGVLPDRSEEHTSELQSRPHLVCRLLLE